MEFAILESVKEAGYESCSDLDNLYFNISDHMQQHTIHNRI